MELTICQTARPTEGSVWVATMAFHSAMEGTLLVLSLKEEGASMIMCKNLSVKSEMCEVSRRSPERHFSRLRLNLSLEDNCRKAQLASLAIDIHDEIISTRQRDTNRGIVALLRRPTQKGAL